ncbi:MAG: hypothetical protein AAF551_02845 [Bacteroidota bacterium]
MAVTAPQQIEELSFDDYTKRQKYEVTSEGLVLRSAKIMATDKFHYHHGAWEKSPYPGYAIVSMVSTNPGNDELTSRLEKLQRLLTDLWQVPNSCFMLPPDSFHQTVANTLSAGRFEKYIRSAGIEQNYPAMIQEAFEGLQDTGRAAQPITMQLIGLSIFGSAIGILGIFQKSTDFQRIVDFREAFYSNATLNAIDIRRTRPFIGHITLAYLDGDFTADDRNGLVAACEQINQEVSNQEMVFKISKTALRRYDDLSCFHTDPSYPEYSFLNP